MKQMTGKKTVTGKTTINIISPENSGFHVRIEVDGKHIGDVWVNEWDDRAKLSLQINSIRETTIWGENVNPKKNFVISDSFGLTHCVDIKGEN